MNALFNWLGSSLGGSLLTALAGSFLWGVFSVLLSPCHLSSIPLIVGFLSGHGKMTPGRSFGLASVFALGILITIALIGWITALLGRMMGDLGPAGNLVVAAVMLYFGLHLLGLAPLPIQGLNRPEMKRKGVLGALLMGLVFGLAVGPCTFAFMAPMLGIVFRTAGSQPLFATGLVSAYGVGHCLVIAVAGASVSLVQKVLNWNQDSWGSTLIRKMSGVLVILGGIYLIVTLL